MKLNHHIFILILTALLLLNCSSEKNKDKADVFIDSIQLLISDSCYSILKKNRDSALKIGIITPLMKSYIPGELLYNNKVIPVKIRFKGDWTDHLKGDKWSFRISILGDNSFNGLKSFSIQSPETRTFLDEWIMHKLFKQEDILTTRYEFINVKLNNKKLGLYVYEEHFEKQLLEANCRREGPIVKFDETGLWESRELKEFHNIRLPYFEAAEVIPFKKKRIKKKPTLFKNFELATELMLKYKELDGNLNEIFDLKKAAQYFALCDIGRVRHSMHWHNQRFYFNPISNSLEHIGFDCFAGFDEGENDVILGYTSNDKIENPMSFLNKQFFNSPIFKKHYLDYLTKYSSEKFQQQIENNYKEDYLKLLKALNKEFESYSFNLDRYKENAKLINQLLKEYSTINSKFILHQDNYDHLDTLTTNYYFPSIGLKAKRNNRKNNLIVSLENFHNKNMEIVGYADKQNKTTYFKKSFLIGRFGSTNNSIECELDSFAEFICFKIAGNPLDLCKINSYQYKSSRNFSIHNEKNATKRIPNDFSIDSSSFTISLSKGNYSIKNPVIIPENWKLVISSGANINFKNNSYLKSYSPVNFNGTASEPIFITNGNITVLSNKNDTSYLSFVEFDSLQHYENSSHTLTGAVSIYNTTVTIDNCKFSNNFSEDALNVISSDFTLSNSLISNTFSDGFDGDFCTGKIENCVFQNCNNDGIDLSGSNTSINSCSILNIKDKAISGGESSTLTIQNCSIKAANIGVASKDASSVNISSTSIDQTQVCYAVFQKKSEYNPATMTINSPTEENFKSLYLLDLKSKISYKEQVYIGSKHVNVDSLYLPFK